MEVKRGQVLFYHENGLVAKTIQKVTKGEFNHIELVVYNNVSLEVRPRHIGLIDMSTKELKLDEYIVIKDPKWSDMNMAINHALKVMKEAKGYSLGNITAWFAMDHLRRGHRKDYESDDWIICSELVADCLEIGGVRKNTTIENSLLSPNDILKYFDFED